MVDTGTDGSLDCFQTTTMGENKVIDQIDVTGRGDVDMSTEATAKVSEGKLRILGASGRELILNDAWKNPSGKWKIACRPYLECVDIDSKAQSEVNKRAGKVEKEQLATLRVSLIEKLSEAVGDEKEDVQKQLDSLEMLNCLPVVTAVVDFVAWHDGSVFRAVVSTKTDLSELKPMTDFAKEHQWAYLDAEAAVSFSLNFYENGKVLTMYTPGTHGTHCGAIAAAHMPSDPKLNGVAPGARLLNIRIGSLLLGGCETHASVERLVRVCIEHEVDIISMSFGEAAFGIESNFGRLMTQAIRDHGIIFLVSAGNDGPCHNTGGHPYVPFPHFQVGAAITPDLANSSYGQIGRTSTGLYRFSSRGPGVDGGFNATIVAPGGATTFDVGYNQVRLTLKNGTSMACPSAAGSVALVLSALKQKKIAYTPWNIVSAGEASASVEFFDKESETWADYGCGMLRPLQMLELLEKTSTLATPMPCAVIAQDSHGQQGLMLRGGIVRATDQKFSISVHWPKSTPVAAKLAWSEQLTLQSDQPWITSTASVSLSNSGCKLRVRADPTGLAAGKAHFGKVTALNEVGLPVFHVPVSIFVPIQVPNFQWESKEHITLVPEKAPFRLVLEPPAGATHFTLEVTVQSFEGGTQRNLCEVGVQHLLSGTPSGESFCSCRFSVVNVGQKLERSYRCVQAVPIDIALATGSSDDLSFSVSLKVRFWSYFLEGTFANSATGEPVVYSGMGPTCVAIHNQSTLVQKSAFRASLTHVVQTYAPRNKPTPRLMSDRFRLHAHAAALSEVVLEYDIEIPTDGNVHIGTITDVLTYPSPVNSEFLLYRADTLELVRAFKWSAKRDAFSIAKGSYLGKCVVRHADPSVLQAVSSKLTVGVKLPLKQAKTLSLHSSVRGAIVGSDKVGSLTVMDEGQINELWISPTATIPDFCRPGDVLHGTLKLATAYGGDIAYPLSYVVQNDCFKVASKSSAFVAPSSSTTLQHRLQEAELQSAAQFFSTLKKEPFSAWDQAATEKISSAHDLSLEVVNQLRLVCLQAALKDQVYDRALAIAGDIVASIDPSELAQHFGMRSTDAAARARMTMRRNALIEALIGKYVAASALQKADESKDALTQLEKWIEPTDKRQISLHRNPSATPGRALWAVLSQVNDSSATLNKETAQTLLTIFQRLGWSHFELKMQEALAFKK